MDGNHTLFHYETMEGNQSGLKVEILTTDHSYQDPITMELYLCLGFGPPLRSHILIKL